MTKKIEEHIELPVEYDSMHYSERWKVRNEYVRVQEGLCYYCNAPSDNEPSAEIKAKRVTPRLYRPDFSNIPFTYITVTTLA